MVKRSQQRFAVFLTGYMGAGKTVVGKALAERLKWRFVDLDQFLETREALQVTQIFEGLGEAEFRKRESQALADVMARANASQPQVIALGGGTLTQAENMEMVRDSGQPIVFLDAPIEELWRRCSTGSERGRRPLQTGETSFGERHRARMPDYQKAHVRIENFNKPVKGVVAEIERWLQNQNTSTEGT